MAKGPLDRTMKKFCSISDKHAAKGSSNSFADWAASLHAASFSRTISEIPISNKKDPIEAYAYFLTDVTENGIGCDNNILTDSYIRVAKNLEADGLVFNQLFGCHSVSNCYRLLKDKIRKDLEIPSMYYTFNRIGENVEQVNTRLGAFMEMF